MPIGDSDGNQYKDEMAYLVRMYNKNITYGESDMMVKPLTPLEKGIRAIDQGTEYPMKETPVDPSLFHKRT